MRFVAGELPGVWVIEPERQEDERGWFARTFDAQEFASRGMDEVFVQCNASYSPRVGTLRGMHYQAAPHGESKLVRCTRGRVFDVAVDLRPDSATYRRWQGLELSEGNGLGFYLPAGIAHGFQTLSDDCEVLYQMGHRYVPEAAAGVRWDDPAFAIGWPRAPTERTISSRDRSYPDYAA